MQARAAGGIGADRRLAVAALLAAGAVVSGAGAYGYQWLAARTLGPAGLAPIALLWTMQYLIVAIVLFAVEAHLARAYATGVAPGAAHRHAARWTLAAAVLPGAAAFLLRDRLFGGAPSLWLAVPTSALLYGAFVHGRGHLAGAGHTRRYAAATALEGLGRAGGAAMALTAGGAAVHFAAALALAPLAAVPFLWPRRPHAGAAEHLPLMPPLRATVVANGMAHLLLAGGPLLLALAGRPSSEVALLFLTTSLARIPLVVALNGLLPRLVVTVTRLRADGVQAIMPRLAAGAAAGGALTALGVGAAAAALGPAVLPLVFGPEFTVQPAVAVAATAGALLATSAFTAGAVLVGLGRERCQPLPWAAGLLAAALLWVAPWGDAVERAAATLPIGAFVALVGLTRVAVMPPDANADSASGRGAPTVRH